MAGWQRYLHPKGQPAVTGTFDSLRREWLCSALTALSTLGSQKLLLVDLGAGSLILPIRCIASLCSFQGCSWENLTCSPTLGIQGFVLGVETSPFSPRTCAAQEAACHHKPNCSKEIKLFDGNFKSYLSKM